MVTSPRGEKRPRFTSSHLVGFSCTGEGKYQTRTCVVKKQEDAALPYSGRSRCRPDSVVPAGPG